jgi:hypothetical protein
MTSYCKVRNIDILRQSAREEVMLNRTNIQMLEAEDCKICKLIISIVYAPLAIMLLLATVTAIT